MNLFDQLVGETLRSRGDPTTLRPVVEKVNACKPVMDRLFKSANR
jgi:hypothetical protein